MKQRPHRRAPNTEKKNSEAPASSSDPGAKGIPPFNSNNKKKRGGRSGGKPFNQHALKNAKSKSGYYNPAEIKKQREFYKNAKYIKKYKKLKQQTEHESGQTRMDVISEEDNALDIQHESNETKSMNMKERQKIKINLQSLREEYEKKKQEEEKARMEADAIRQAKKAEREEIAARKKELKHKMFRRTTSGQPIMKYRLDNLIENLQRSRN